VKVDSISKIIFKFHGDPGKNFGIMHFWKIGKFRNLGNFGYFIVHDINMMWRPHGRSDMVYITWTTTVVGPR
jgi:hypothetical protein